MKILTIASTSFFSDRGSHIRIYQEAKYLEKFGHEVLIFCYGLGKEMPGVHIKRINANGWYKKTSPGFSWGKIYLDLEMALKGALLIKNEKPEAIHAHLFEGLGVAWLAVWGAWLLSGFRLKRPPILLDLQGDLRDEFESYNQEKTFAKKIFVNLSYFLIKAVKTAVVSSENALQILKSKYPKTDFYLVKDGIDLDFFSQIKSGHLVEEKSKLELEKIRQWQGADRVLIYTGGMEKGKGVQWLMEEFVHGQPSGWKLLLFGGGHKKKAYQQKMANQEKVFFAKDNSYLALSHYLNLADVAIEPKRNSTESSGKLLNYMAAGLPIIGFDNQFNRLRLGGQGFYLKEKTDLKSILESGDFNRVQYDLEVLSAEKEVRKLEEILSNLK